MPPRTTLALFAYRSVLPETMLSIIRELRAWPELQFAWGGNHAMIERTRSIVATDFLDRKGNVPPGDVLVMVDHDIAWETGDVRDIADRATEYGVVSGVYAKRGHGLGVPIRGWWDRDEVQITPGEDRVVEVQYAPAGFLAIHRDVLAAIPEPRLKDGVIPFFHTLLYGGEWLSEDWAFCGRVRRTNDYKVYADFRPVLRHTGEYEYRLEDAVHGGDC